MKDLSCDEVVERLPALVVGDLNSVEQAEIAHHTADCAWCAEQVAEGESLSRVLDLLATGERFAARVDAALPALRERLMAALPADLAYDRLDSPVGPLYVVVSPRGLVRINFGGSEEAIAALARMQGVRVYRDAAKVRAYAAQLREYFAGERREFDLPVDLPGLSPFSRQVLQATAAIPFGRLVTYREIAMEIGQPGATRAVGNALGRNPVPIVIPCHRVVRSGGAIGGYGGGLAIKWRLLEIEGSSLAVTAN